jgi:RND family efflux transporter MFP subunit
MVSRKRITLYISAILLVVAGLLIWQRSGELVSASDVTRGSAVELVYATGVVEPVVQATVSPEVNGRISEWYVNEGDTVALSAPLVRLFDAEQYADVSELMIRVANEEIALQRDADLLSRKVGSRETYDNSKAALEQSRARLAAAQVRLQQRTLKAPPAGQVIRREREIGETVIAGQTLLVVAQLDQLRVTMDIDEEDIPRVAQGQTVLLSNDAFPNQVFKGTISEITPQGDSASKTYRVRASLPAATTLPVAMSVEANVVLTERSDALLVPASSVRDNAVYGLNGHRAERREVKLGIVGVDKIEILEGLNEGDRVVAAPPKDLVDGARVRLKPEQ